MDWRQRRDGKRRTNRRNEPKQLEMASCLKKEKMITTFQSALCQLIIVKVINIFQKRRLMTTWIVEIALIKHEHLWSELGRSFRSEALHARLGVGLVQRATDGGHVFGMDIGQRSMQLKRNQSLKKISLLFYYQTHQLSMFSAIF